MKNKLTEKIVAMRKKEKKGMEVLGWILTIGLTIAVVGIIWFFVRPAVNDTSNEAMYSMQDDSGALIGNASLNAQSGTEGDPKPEHKAPTP